MNLMKKAIAAAFVLSIIVTAADRAICQETTTAESSFDVSLRLIVGSNEGAARQLPPELGGISRMLKERFAFSNYRLAGTLMGRVSNGGSFEYKSVADIFGKQADGPQTFFDWNVRQLRAWPTSKGQAGALAESFRFGARVPVAGVVRDESGKASPTINYESIGLTVNRLGLAENAPALIGTLNLPSTDGTIFLVMTVRSLDQ